MESLAPLLVLILIIFLAITGMNKLFKSMGIQFLNPFLWFFNFIIKPPSKDDGMMKNEFQHHKDQKKMLWIIDIFLNQIYYQLL